VLRAVLDDIWLIVRRRVAPTQLCSPTWQSTRTHEHTESLAAGLVVSMASVLWLPFLRVIEAQSYVGLKRVCTQGFILECNLAILRRKHG
jgi:hypothetical protein